MILLDGPPTLADQDQRCAAALEELTRNAAHDGAAQARAAVRGHEHEGSTGRGRRLGDGRGRDSELDLRVDRHARPTPARAAGKLIQVVSRQLLRPIFKLVQIRDGSAVLVAQNVCRGVLDAQQYQLSAEVLRQSGRRLESGFGER